jgi:(2S)-methylsuccinyl-CoA dehydrogenase
MDAALAGGHRLLRACIDGIVQAHGGGRGAAIGTAFLDSDQVTLYEVAFATAELSAAGALAARAGIAGEETRWLAEYACADALLSLRQRLAALPRHEPPAHTLAAVFDDALAARLRAARAPERLSAIVERLTDAGGELPGSEDGTEAHIMRQTFRRFADDVVSPLAGGIHRQNLTVPDSIVDGLRRLGCFGLSVPQRFGGLRPDAADDSSGMLIATEELSRASLGAAGSLITRPEIVARALLEGGTRAQQAHWLPAIARGEPLCAVSVTEPAAGSDVAAVSLRATPAPGGWRLHGAKTWCTLAGLAGVILVIARTRDVSPPHRGLSLFLVEKPPTRERRFHVDDGHGGSLTGSAIDTLGYRGMHSFELAFDGFFVPASHLVGGQAGEGRGFYHTMRGFAAGRLQTAARANGLMRAAFEAALAYAGTRQVFGRPLRALPLTQAKLARMAALIASHRAFASDAAAALDSGGAGGQMQASLVKLSACRAAEWVTREALQLHGGIGYAEESAVCRHFADARVLSIFEGAEETLAVRVIGRELVERAARGEDA